MQVAVLDDYQDVALRMADWTVLPPTVKVEVFRDHLSRPEEIARRLREFEVVVAMRERTPFRRALLSELPRLKLLITTGMINASIDLDAANEMGITVCGTGGVAYPPAELTWGLILALLRQIPQEDRAIRGGQWQTTLGHGARGKFLGLVGLGRLGEEVAKIGKGFGMSILAWSSNLSAERAEQCGAELVTKDELFSRSDVISIHLKLSERSRGIVGLRELNLMKPSAYLINTSRGPIVEEQALIDALRRGTIAGAGLDVYDQEPLPRDHPFLTLPNTVITPHIGFVTEENYRISYSHVVEDIAAFLKGEPIRVISGERRN